MVGGSERGGSPDLSFQVLEDVNVSSTLNISDFLEDENVNLFFSHLFSGLVSSYRINKGNQQLLALTPPPKKKLQHQGSPVWSGQISGSENVLTLQRSIGSLGSWGLLP